MSLDLLSPTRFGPERWFDSGPVVHVSSSDCGTRFSARKGPTLTYLWVCVEVSDLSAMRGLAYELYDELLATMERLGVPRFVRIWNYIPSINEGLGDNECYRQFCWGRADALGDSVLPAATAIGSHDGWLRIGALCTGPIEEPGTIGIEHLENPRQVSAYQYPRDYGPRSPSFARATLVTPPKGTSISQDISTERHSDALLLVSGTSSIVRHETMHRGDLAAQTKETLLNFEALFDCLDTGSKPCPLALRFYLREPLQLELARASWASNAAQWPEPAWYQGDLCRSDLSMEIEGVFSV